jgi:hypothetical protein
VFIGKTGGAAASAGPDQPLARLPKRAKKSAADSSKGLTLQPLRAAVQQARPAKPPEGSVMLDERAFIDQLLARHLRPHQVEGVRFLYKCVTGAATPNNFGAILAVRPRPRGVRARVHASAVNGMADFCCVCVPCAG